MPRHRFRANYEQLFEFGSCCTIGLKNTGWANRRMCLATIPASKWALMISEDISGDAQCSVVFRAILTAQRYVDDILRTVLLPFVFQYPGKIL
ncbi:hypothetical protein TNCV_655231 [Trichonephila clavipes]|nr:hypothetical protein TNCV_655231 [Trichonephila clavipes]